ncbi:sodium:proton antiporter [Panacibacter ginsenosidivorans]|uniref:Sodium:proton antiporter n=1 Tax=Panacibacter ginsenosidivorans TaxID=1813871 RepID=A0A5B8V639_9BACT|nr:Na+/H+ antiporter NhaC family protein [Panacibacter ginsenosidivorans]QEC66106.1 sodium:proton antiporter [Panacibacter ginsenosidivorans]
MDYGALALIPPLVVIVLAILLRASFEALLIGCITGFIIISVHDNSNFFTDFIATFYKVMEDESTVWVILVCGLYGSLIGLMVRSGGAMKFGEDMLRLIKSKRAALFGTWFLGLFIFLDDYLSALTVGITMKKITDHFKIPREYLAYIVNTTAPPWCVIVPLSTWTLFIGSVLEKCNFATTGQGNHVYLSVVPFVMYGWISVLLIPLVILGVIPVFGRMKKAQVRAELTGETIPGKSKMTSLKMEHFETEKKPSALFFILPLAVTLIATFALNYDALKGVMIGVAFTFIYYLFIKLGTFQQISETVFTGFNSMVYALALVVISYILKEVGDKMGLTQYVINGVKPMVSKELLPFLIFVSISLITYTTGSSWGVYAVVIPIVIPLAQSIGSNVLMSIGAVISAGVFGANACLYSDATILTSQSTELNNLDHSLSQLPYALLAFVLTALSYVGLGYLM